jgi:hypothetical protein
MVEIDTTTRKQKDAVRLPEGSTENNRFRAVFITTYICWVAQYPDPWRIENEEAVNAMQKIWAAVYDKRIQFKVTTDSSVFKQVCHRFQWVAVIVAAAIFRQISGCATVGALLLAPQRSPL